MEIKGDSTNNKNENENEKTTRQTKTNRKVAAEWIDCADAGHCRSVRAATRHTDDATVAYWQLFKKKQN